MWKQRAAPFNFFLEQVHNMEIVALNVKVLKPEFHENVISCVFHDSGKNARIVKYKHASISKQTKW